MHRKMSSKNIQKFEDLLVFIVSNFSNNGTLTPTKLWKLFYFCEAGFYEKNKRTITGVDYFKNNYGPTPDQKISEKALKEVGKYINTEKIKKDDGKTITVFDAKPNTEYKFQSIGADEIEEARNICGKYFQLSVEDICLLAHKDPPYLGADKSEKGDRIDFDFVFYRDPKDDEDFIEKSASIKKVNPVSVEGVRGLIDYVRKNP